MLTILYAGFMVSWTLAMAIILLKILPIAGRWEFGKITPRITMGILCVFAMFGIARHLSDFDTKPEELAFAAILSTLFWWVVWFHKGKLNKIDSYF